MKTISKALVGTVAAAAMAVASASPAMARDRDRGIDGGDILAGALIIGGIAAVAAAASSNNNRDRYDNNYGGRYNDRYNDRDRRHYGRGGEQAAVNQCINAAERTATRYTNGGRAQVTDIRDVDRERRGFEVKGKIAVPRNDRNYRRGGQRWDEGRFTCQVRRGQVVDIDFRGIRGL